MARSYIKVFFDWNEVTAELTDAEKGRLIGAMLAYARGDPYQLPGNERFVFPAFKAQLDRDAAAYEEISEKRKQAGAKGGRQKQANASICYQEQANPSKSSQDKDQDKDKDKDKEWGYNARDGNGTQLEPGWNPNGTQMEPDWNPPTPEEVRQYMDEYASGRGLHVDTARASERFWNHYAGKGWTVQHWQPFAASWIEEDARNVQSNPALGYEQRKLTDEDFAGVLINFDEGATP